MEIYIDESGDFNFKDKNRVSVIASVVIPENKKYKLKKFLKKLHEKVSIEEKDAEGEIKGCAMRLENLRLVFDFLSKNIDFRITLAVFDHSLSSEEDIVQHRLKQGEKFQAGKEHYLTGTVKAKAVTNFFDEKKRWVERSDLISDVLYIQLSLQVQVIEETLKKILVHYYDDSYRGQCFKKFTFIIDRKNKKMKKPEKYISELIYGFLETEWSGRKPYVTIDDLGKNNHPFMKFDVKKNGRVGTDLKKILGDGLKFEDSKNYDGIQLADFIASGVRRIIIGDVDKSLFNLIRKNAAFFENGWQPVTIATFCLTGQKKKIGNSDIYNFLQRSPKDRPL